MRSRIQIVLPLLVSLTILCGASSCSNTQIKWNPDWYVGDYVVRGIVNENNEIIYADQHTFNNYSCLSKEKFIELAEILRRARLPKDVKKDILSKFPLLKKRRF